MAWWFTGKSAPSYQNLRHEIDQLQKENDHYTGQIKALQTDPKTIEKEAREQLHYARPGEVVYVAPAPPPSRSPPPTPPRSRKPDSAVGPQPPRDRVRDRCPHLSGGANSGCH